MAKPPRPDCLQHSLASNQQRAESPPNRRGLGSLYAAHRNTMSPTDSTNERRVVLLPLPFWILYQVGLLLVWSYRLVRWKVFPRLRTSEHGLAAHHHNDRCSAIAILLFRHLNIYREQHGLRPLYWNERLEMSSLYQSQRMNETGEFAHELSDGVTLADRIERVRYPYLSCGENLYWIHDVRKDITALAWAMHDGWVHSPGHQKNLVGDWTEVGIGVLPDGEGGFYATQNFGKPRGVF